MMTKVYLIRHGETEGAESRRYKGHIDVLLSEKGMEQMKRVADFIVGAGLCACPIQGQPQRVAPTDNILSAVYCSDLSRAIKSAEIIAGPFALKPEIVEGLKERNFGVWEGMTFDEIREKWPDAFNSWAVNPLKFSPMGGESTIEVRDRVRKAFYEIIERNKGRDIAIVSHGGVIRVLLCEMLGMPLENIFRIDQDYAALNVIELWDYPVVRHINYVV